MQKKNNLYLILMAGSILVLILVQYFWLASVYKDYKNSLKQETRLLFATTVTGMLDSLVLRDLTPVFVSGIPDTAFFSSPYKNFSFQDSLRSVRIEVKRESIGKDSLKGQNSKIQIITTGDPGLGDSLRRVFRPLMMGIDSLNKDQKFTYTMNRESLDPQLVETRFNEVLAERRYPIVAKVKRLEVMKESDPIPVEAISLEEIRIPFGTRIVGYIENYRGFILKKMLNPFLFALMVVLFISWSMLFFYRNMLKQQKLNLLKNDIISNITHELKTPISTVSVVLESLQNFGANENPNTKDEYIRIAKNELKRLTSMTDNILKSSVLGSNQPETQVHLDLSNLLEENLNTFKPILDSKGFEFSLEEKGTDFTVNGNAEQLSLVIFNLIDNAIKYSKERFYIKVSLINEPKSIVLKIEDKGIGVPESYQKDIFEKFIRVPQHDVHDVKGYGLGLAQVAEIVRLHKGKINLESHPGKGSIFTIQLPKV
jgi:two-component system, OmpR family, phosphate regulon sensor histidine kinase PhoR